MSMLCSSAWMGLCVGILCTCIFHGLAHAFAQIPIGIHSFYNVFVLSLIAFGTSFGFRQVYDAIFPFELCLNAVCSMFISNVVLGVVKFIPHVNFRTDEKKYYGYVIFV